MLYSGLAHTPFVTIGLFVASGQEDMPGPVSFLLDHSPVVHG